MTIIEFLSKGPATSKQIQSATGLNQSAVSRQLRALGGRVIKLPRSRSPIYAITRNAFGSDDNIPLFMVDRIGNTVPVAIVRPLAHGGFYVQPTTAFPVVLAGENKDGLYDDLPYFLQDLRPQGFLGRLVARELASISDEFPSDPRIWTTNHIGRYLVSNGDDLPGNFKLGHHTHLRLRRPPIACGVDEYPSISQSVLNGQSPGSSAGGEQPKFTAFSKERAEHVIVKFSPASNDLIAMRWRDVLITEYHATATLREALLPAAQTRLIEVGEQFFLESIRFDRCGEYGRLPMISLQAVDSEYVGLGENWAKIMWQLCKLELVSDQHAIDAEILWHFGRLINNTDMHLGNLSLGIEGDAFRLLPAYDMCSMGFAPTHMGVPPFKFSPPVLSDSDFVSELARSNISVGSVNDLAYEFWARVGADWRISGEFKEFILKEGLGKR